MRMKTKPAVGLAVLLLGCVHAERRHTVRKPAQTARAFDRTSYRALIVSLAADEMEGRGVLTRGNARAARLLGSAFARAGLSPGGTAKSFEQCFGHPVALQTGKRELVVDGEEIAQDAVMPAALSAAARFAGELVFAGYGISAPELNYDDYSALDAKDKVLLLLRFEPQERDPRSVFNGAKPSRYSALRRKVFEARNRGAAAVLFVVPPREGKLDRRVPTPGDRAETSAGLPVLHVLPSVVDGWLKAKGTSLAEQVAAIDRDLSAKPLVLGTARGTVKVKRAKRRLCNVIGVLPGKGALSGEAVVIGAHFDHLGYGQRGSMVPGVEAIHSGADDNASGTAGLVYLAHHFAQLKAEAPSMRTLVFAAFNGEEVGLAGSSTYVKQPTVSLKQTVAMLNMDMIGRLRKHLVVFGTGTGDRWRGWLDQAAARHDLSLSTHGDGYGASDHTPFFAAKVPVLHFFTGPHRDHHKPSDVAARLNYGGAIRILRTVADLLHRVATAERLAFRETAAGPAMAADSRGYGAWLGTVPDFTTMSPGARGGVKLAGVRKRGPADMAGIKAGDRIVSIAGREIENLYDMNFVLRDHQPGAVVDIVLLRDGKQVRTAATLGSRGQRAGPHRGHPHGGHVRDRRPRGGHPGRKAP